MMDYGYGGGGGWMWVFGGLLMLGFLVLIGVAVWAVVTAQRRSHAAASAPDGDALATGGGRARVRQILDERYARGEINSEEYAERLRTLGW
jgi:putative membrane protein